MVLRGSNIVPPSLQEAETAKRNAAFNLVKAKEELDEAKIETFQVLTDESIYDLEREELIMLVQDLRNRVKIMERREILAQEKFSKSQIELQKTVTSLACGGAAGAFARTTVAPIDRVKILMQTAHLKGTETKYPNIFKTFQTIVKEEGIQALWRGNFTNCIRVIPHTATQFTSYEKYKALLVDDGEKMTVFTRLAAGALAGMTAATVTHPMDVVRIRLQTQPELKGALDAMRSVHAENGLRTFYKGYVPAMLSLSPFIAINFSCFDFLKTTYYGDVKMSKKELQQRNPAIILGLGAIAGIVAQTACYPLDTIRRRMQMAGKNYSSMGNALVTITKEEGIRGFYKGMSANALKVVPNNAIRFAAFEVLRSYFATEEAIKRQNSVWSSTGRKKTVAQ